MNDFLIFLHSWLRWIILLLGLIVLIRSYAGLGSNKLFTNGDNKRSAIFVGLFHLQVLIGLILYFFVSPIIDSAFENFGGAMKNSELRFWAVEHILTMIIAAVLIQIGRSKSKKARYDKNKHKFIAIYYTIGLILVLLRIPWNEAERLFRGL